MDRTWYEFKAKADANETEVLLYDEIGGFGVSASRFISELQAVPKTNRLVLRIHSPGGSVLDGNAIFTTLKNWPGGITTHIDGLAASMATVVALAGEPVKMAGNGIFMIHNVSAGAYGDSEDMRRMADITDKIQETIVAVYVAKTGMSRRKVMQMMDAETWLTASEAKDLGFVDEITGDLAMAAKFDPKVFRNAPAKSDLFDTPAAQLPTNMSEPTISQDDRSILDKLKALFIPAPVDPVAQLTADLATTRGSVSDLTAKLKESEKQVSELTASVETGKKALEEATAKIVTPEDIEKQVGAEVVKRIAASGTNPIKRDPNAAVVEGQEMKRTEFEAMSPARKSAFCLKGGKVID